MKKQNTTLILVECALMIAMSTVLSMFKIFELPQGGAVTCASMVPMVILSFRHGPKWGLTAAFAESLLQMILKFDAPTAKTFVAFTLVILLDYVLAFTSIGAASIFGKPFKNRMVSVGVGAFCVSSSFSLQLCVRHCQLGRLHSQRHTGLDLFPYLQRFLYDSGSHYYSGCFHCTDSGA